MGGAGKREKEKGKGKGKRKREKEKGKGKGKRKRKRNEVFRAAFWDRPEWMKDLNCIPLPISEGNIIDRRFCLKLRMKGFSQFQFLLDHGIIYISKGENMANTIDGASRFFSFLNPRVTEVTGIRLIIDFVFCIEIPNFIRTGLHTSPALNTELIIDDRHPLGGLSGGLNRFYRAGLHTRGIRTMHTGRPSVHPNHVWIFSALNLFYPCSKLARRNLIWPRLFTGDRTGITSNTTSEINNHYIPFCHL